MPVSSETSISGPYTPNGVTTSFAFDFKAASASEVVATDGDGNVISTALYSVTLDDDEGGMLTFGTAPEASDYSEIYVLSEPELTQPSDFDNAGPSFNPAALTRAIDRAAIRDLKLNRDIGRALKLPFGEVAVTFPGVAERANKYISFLPNGDVLMSSGTGADSGLREDIASSTGGAMVGTAEGGNLEDAIPYITPQQKGGTWDVDSTAALEDTLLGIINTDQPAVINKRIRVDGAIESGANVSLQGTGVIDLSGGGSLKFGTGVTALPNLAADIAYGATSITFDSDPGLSVGDVVAAWNPTDFSQAPFRAEYRAGDMFKVAGIISPTQVRIFGTAREAFAAADVLMFKLNGGRLSWDGIGLIPSASAVPVFLDGLVDINLNRILIEAGVEGTAIEIFRSYGASITAPRIVNLDESNGYPIIISNSQNGLFNGMNEVYSGWHCISFGGRNGDGSVPSADWIVANAIATSKGNIGVGALESHGGCKRITFDGIQSDVLNPGGEDITVRNARIYGRDPATFADGNAVYGAEIVGGTFLFENVHTIAAGNGSAFGAHYHLEVGARTKPFNFIGRNLTMEAKNNPASIVRVMTFELGTTVTTVPIDIHLDGVKALFPVTPGGIVRLNNSANVSAVTSLHVDNYDGPLDNLVTATNASNYDITYSGNLRRDLTGYISRGQTSPTLSADRVRSASGFSPKVNIWDAAFGANRTVTLSTSRAKAGDTFKCVRTGGDTGGPWTLDVGGLKSLSQNQWCEVTFDGAAWKLTAYGSL